MPENNRQFLMSMHDGQSYVVQFTLSCVPYKTKRFKASEHGGMLKAKTAAIAWRDQQLAEDPKLGGTPIEASDETVEPEDSVDQASAEKSEASEEVDAKATDDSSDDTKAVTAEADDKPAAKKDVAEKKKAKPPAKRKKSEKASKPKAPAEKADAEKPEPAEKKSKKPVAVEAKPVEVKTAEEPAPVETKAVKAKDAETKAADTKAPIDEPKQAEMEFVDPADLGHSEPDLLFDIIEKTPPTIMIKADVEGVTRRINVATKGWHKSIEQAYSRGYKILNKVDPQAASIPEYAPDGGLLEVLQELQKANVLNDKWEPIK